MRLARTLIPFVIAIPVAAIAFSACGGSSDDGPDNDPFDSYQACYNEHHMTEGFDSQCAIEICCIDHPIGSAAMNVVCGDTAQSCETYVNANLTDGSDASLSTDVTAACQFYFVDSGRGSGTGGKCSG